MPKRKSFFQRVTIVGVGLMGGSFGLALKRAGFTGRIVGCDREEVLRRARRKGAFDDAVPEITYAVRGADLILLAPPVGSILDSLRQMKDHVSPSALVTDVGSTKKIICIRARETFQNAPLFLGGHPLAGRERSGIRNAVGSLFEGRRYMLTPNSPDDLNDPRVKAFSELIEKIGGKPFVTDPQTHDRAMALLSHLPQLLSTGLAGLIWDRTEEDFLPLEMAATGFRDVTRLAQSPYSVWRDICLTNQENIQDAIELMVQKLESLKLHLSDRELEREFKNAFTLRKKFEDS